MLIEHLAAKMLTYILSAVFKKNYIYITFSLGFLLAFFSSELFCFVFLFVYFLLRGAFS